MTSSSRCSSRKLGCTILANPSESHLRSSLLCKLVVSLDVVPLLLLECWFEAWKKNWIADNKTFSGDPKF